MYTLYIANKNYSTWSLRPWVLMRTLGIEFQEQLVPLGSRAEAGGFRRFSPSGKLPCLIDDGFVVWDTLAIAEYLAEHHPGVWPIHAKARAWARCAAAEMHSGFGSLRERCPMSLGIRVRLDHVPPALTRDIDRIDELWCEGLGSFGGPFLAGEGFTAVDAFFAPVTFRAQIYSLALSEPAAAYAERVRGLPAMRDWYAAALLETWREPEQEGEAERAGFWLEDLRASATHV